jgi:hypothetical protein
MSGHYELVEVWVEDEDEDESDEDNDTLDQREDERLARCTCGAWIYRSGRYICVADCICGNT